ncbi:MAG TPA: hydroxysqualene dehydroxylase HpnE [Casimicrobiaceae bacterium]|nr:hydroxysqualene dehydroxylase HpnE [Casimicrobiaceae bacterium]
MDDARVAIIGGGWAGLAAAVTLAAAGRAVTVFEAAPSLGGRARRVELRAATVDNGQHILLGGYRQTLELLRLVHGARHQRELLERRRLHIEEPGVFRLHAPRLPAPWHALTAILTMRGVSRPDRLTTAAFARRLKGTNFHCGVQLTVSALLVDQPPDVIDRLWAPLCISALNTPPDKASAQIFLNLLRQGFTVRARDSDTLLPRVDLGALFPDAAARFVGERGGEVRLGRSVAGIATVPEGVELTSGGASERFAAAVIAVGPHQVGMLLTALAAKGAAKIVSMTARFTYEPIVTAFLSYPRALGVKLPMLKLDGKPGQWLFDREQLGGPAGLAAVVISADVTAVRGDHASLAQAIDAQLRRLVTDLPPPSWSQVIAEQRATYACVAGLERPSSGLIAPRVYLAGDYTDPELPGTLESATRSGVAAARQLIAASTARSPACAGTG